MTSSQRDTHGCLAIKRLKFKQLLVYCCVGGGREDTSDAFQVLSVLPDIGAAFAGAGERSALCARAETQTVFKALVGKMASFFKACFTV